MSQREFNQLLTSLDALSRDQLATLRRELDGKRAVRLRGVKLGFSQPEASRGQVLCSTPRQSSGVTYGCMVRTAAARRAGSASIASSSATADSASFMMEAAIFGDTNGPDVPSW